MGQWRHAASCYPRRGGHTTCQRFFLPAIGCRYNAAIMEVSDITGIAKIVDSELAKKLYDDAISEPAKEAGELAVDVLKGVRCFTLPFRLAGTAMKRMLADLEACRKRVPDDRQVESPPEIAGPTIERLRFLEDTNPLRQMYLNLLTTSIDKERQGKAHPAFVTILNQMSRDEAVVIDALRQPASLFVALHHVVDHNINLETSDLAFPDQLFDTLEHLSALGLVTISKIQRIPIVKKGKPTEERDVGATGFGKMFIDTCIG